MNEVTLAPPQTSSNALASIQQQVIMVESCRKLAFHYCNTPMVPKAYQGKPEDGAVAIQWGSEVGLAPLQSLQNIAVINGNPSLWGDSLIAIVKGSGQCKYLSTSYDADKKIATVKTKRNNEPEESRTYSMSDATNAGLAGRDTYIKHPERMLSARARSHLLRDVYADLLQGFGIREVAEEDNQAYNLDGRQEKDITPTTDSETLNSLLKNEPQSEDVKMVEDAILGAATAKELKEAGALIPAQPEGEQKERLKLLWFQMKSDMQETK